MRSAKEQTSILLKNNESCARIIDDIHFGCLKSSFLKLAKNSVRRKLFYQQQWNIGITHVPIRLFLRPDFKPVVNWLPALRRDRCRADPFGVSMNGHLVIFCEDFDYSVCRGRIVSIEVVDGVASSPRHALEFPGHASYPYVFEHQGRVYCIPETGTTREVCLYRAESLPDRWAKVATLIRGVGAVDSTVFKHAERWWLACTDRDCGVNSKLLIWHARELVGPWTPHLANPVKIDIRSSRPAGTPFVHEGQLYRPGQDCSRTYGSQIAINRVTRLTPSEFEEVPASVVKPDPSGPYPDGLHTISAVGNLTLIDGLRFVSTPTAWLGKLRLEAVKFRDSRGSVGATCSFSESGRETFTDDR